MKKIILASASPRRKELLEQIGLAFEIIPSDYEEDNSLKMDPVSLVKLFSKSKAESVANKVSDAIVIGVDTVVEFENAIFGKPSDEKEAFSILKKFSGKKHRVLTAYTIIDTSSKKTLSYVSQTIVKFRSISDMEIKMYIQKENVLDKAGAYAIQNYGALLVEEIHGDYYTIIGLPVNKLAQDLKKFGVDVLLK